jgi:hypothetical protein
MTHPAELSPRTLLQEAAQIVCEKGLLTVSLVQRRLLLGYKAAGELVREVRDSGPMESSMRQSAVGQFLIRSLETAIFFRDLHECGEGGHHSAIKLLRPWPGTAMSFRSLLLQELFGARALTLTDAASELTRACPPEHLPDADSDELQHSLALLCEPHERPHAQVVSREEKHARAVGRFARYLRYAGTVFPMHTRSVDYFVQREWIPTGHALELGPNRHHEHVVPCVALIVEAQRRQALDPSWSVADMTAWLQRYLAIVVIPKKRASELDGPLGLRETMPQCWPWDSGCIFERLHKARIAFAPPDGMACHHKLEQCKCGFN